MLPSEPGIPSASYMPTTSSGPWLRPGWTTPRTRPSAPSSPRTCSSLDDLGLHRMTQQQSIDLYELVIARHRTASFVITSNRAVDEWLGLFDDPILGNSALDRLANASYQIVHRRRQLPRNACHPTGPCSTERRWLTLKPNGDNSPSTGPQGGSMTLATNGP